MFNLDVLSRTPVYEQLISQVEEFVLRGLLPASSQIPSVRSLSATLSINPNTIQKAYSELDRRGIIYSVPGRGCFISDTANDIISASRRTKLDELDTLISQLLIAGITKDEIIERIKNI